MYVILVYDIKSEDDGQKILSRTFKTCKKYLSHIQNSVFEGKLTESQVFKLEREIYGIIRSEIDSVIIFKSRSDKWVEKEFWGKKLDKSSNFI